jgi:hypothetical protein
MLIAISALTVCACASQPVISDINDSSIKVQASFTDNSRGDVSAVANNGCGNYGKNAVPISYRCLDGYCISKEFLFACK